MNKIIPVHHSVVDWDFESGATNRSLSATKYVSAPTSLCMLEPGSTTFRPTILCRHPDTLCLPQGEVRNWEYGYYYIKYMANFRNQAPLGSANYTNCYEIFMSAAVISLDRYLAGVYSRRDSTVGVAYSNQWAHYRIFWYNGETPGHVPALCVDVYREITGEWVKSGNTLYDTHNSFKDSAINRAGFRAYSKYNNPQYWDDTEIWGPV
ncbi:hypothetical protein ES705_34478 [subsurface metagenome]